MTSTDISFATIDRDGRARFQLLRRELGVSAFGINLIALAPRERGRIHAHERQEEVYLVLAGTLTVRVDDVEHVLEPDQLVRVAPAVRRQLVNAGTERVLLLALGGAGEHVRRDGIAWTSWDDDGPGRTPQEVPLPDDLPRD